MTDQLTPCFFESELGVVPPEKALFHIIPAPWEASVTYGTGTANGPAAMLRASQQLELFDGISVPAKAGIHTGVPVPCDGEAETVLGRIEGAVDRVLHMKKLPVMIGGEHTVTLGALRAVKKHHGVFGLVQFDAHADLRDTYDGTPYSHACVMRRALDLGLPLFQIGVRALSEPEVELRREKKIGFLDARTLAGNPPVSGILPDDFPPNIYITFDVDGLDPSVMPATGTPEPGGLGWYQALQMLEDIIAGRNVIGCDVVELAPIEGMHAPDYTVARLVYNLMGMIARNGRGTEPEFS